MDIEDLRRVGAGHKACPYFTSRKWADEAELVFCPCEAPGVCVCVGGGWGGGGKAHCDLGDLALPNAPWAPCGRPRLRRGGAAHLSTPTPPTPPPPPTSPSSLHRLLPGRPRYQTGHADRRIGGGAHLRRGRAGLAGRAALPPRPASAPPASAKPAAACNCHPALHTTLALPKKRNGCRPTTLRTCAARQPAWSWSATCWQRCAQHRFLSFLPSSFCRLSVCSGGLGSMPERDASVQAGVGEVRV